MRKALCIWINDYPTCPLNGCVNDARNIADILRKHENKDPNFNVLLMDGKSITKADIKGKIKELFYGDGNISLLYFQVMVS